MNKVLAFFQTERMFYHSIKINSIIYLFFSSTEMLITIDRITRTNPFFTQNFSLFAIDSLPDMYETLIDRPAFVYDSLSNLTFSLTKNITSLCIFFVTQLNYTREECESIFNNTYINSDQVRR